MQKPYDNGIIKSESGEHYSPIVYNGRNTDTLAKLVYPLRVATPPSTLPRYTIERKKEGSYRT